MIRRATVRLPVGVLVAGAGALVSVLLGRPDAALLAAPWAVLLLLGVSGARRGEVDAAVAVAADRVVTGDPIEVATKVGPGTGVVEATWYPGPITGRPPPGADRETRTMVDVLAADRSTVLRATADATEWGTHDVGRVELTVTEPYALLQWATSIARPVTVRVHPSDLELRQLVAPWQVRRLTGAHRSTDVDRGVEYADIRPFGSGDSLRDINWRVSARADELWVSQRHPDRATDVVLLLDSFVESGHDVRTVVGLAIEAAVALAASHLSMTDRVGLIELGGVVRWVSPGTGQHQLHRLTDALLSTGLYANAAERDLTVIPPRALPPRSFVLALSPLLDTRFVDALFTLRGAGHDVAVVDCAPAHDDRLGAGSDEDEPSSARLAQRLWHAERAVTRDRLAERGVAVGRWRHGAPLDPVLLQLTRQRARARWTVAR